MELTTEIGKIYCKYNENTDSFDKMRVTDVIRKNDNTKYVLSYLTDDYKFLPEDGEVHGEVRGEDGYNDLKKYWTLLKSNGIISLSNIISATREGGDPIKDLILIFFPNNKVSRRPETDQPYVVARQGIINIFDPTEETVGVSVSLDTLPANYSLSDFMENESVISSKLCHVYRTDCIENIAQILDNEDTENILLDLYEHEVRALKNTLVWFEDKYKEHPEKFECLKGYNKDLKNFIKNSEFIKDVFHTIGITTVDFIMENNKPLDLDDKLLLSTLYGGIKIDKAVPLKFDYDIDLSLVKMKYLMIRDSNETLWIVPYTVSPDEIDATELYNLTEERTSKLQERLLKCVKAYEQKEVK